MLRCKPGVDFNDMSPQMVLCAYIADQVFIEYGLAVCQINSINDSVHGTTSLHYSGNAIDLDTHDNGISKFPNHISLDLVATEIRKRLGGRHYDIIFHDNHIHAEYQPRRSQQR